MVDGNELETRAWVFFSDKNNTAPPFPLRPGPHALPATILLVTLLLYVSASFLTPLSKTSPE